MKIDFNILQTGNSKSLLFVDESCYTENPVFPTLQVKMPDVERIFKCLIIPEKLNVISLEKLNAGIGEFNDGIYELKYSIEPHKCNFAFKKFMKVDKLLARLKVLLGDESVNKNKLNEVYFLLVSSQLYVNENSDVSLEYLKTASSLLKKLECNV